MNSFFGCRSQRGEMASKRMATSSSSSPPKSKKAEAAKAADAVAAGAPRASVFAAWRSCCCCYLIISFAVAAELFFNCCVPPVMAGETTTTPCLFRRLVSTIHDTTSSWGEDDLKPYEEHVAPKLKKKEWAHVDSIYPGVSSELLVVDLPIPRIVDGKLSFLEKKYPDVADLVMLDDYFASGPMRDENELATDHLEIMTHFMNLLREHFCGKEDLVAIPTAKFLAGKAKSILSQEDGFLSNSVPTIKSFDPKASEAEESKRWNCSMTKVAYTDDDNSKLAAVVDQDSNENIDVRLSLSKPTPIPGASEHGPKVLSWEYNASFKLVSDKLTPIKDSLTVEEEGDSDEDEITGKWILKQKIERSDDDNTDWEHPTSRYSWNMKCSDEFNPTLPGYEYTWNSDFVGLAILNESFVGKTPIHYDDEPTTASESSIAKPKCRWLSLTRENDKKLLTNIFYTGNDRDLVDKVVEYTDGSKVHNYFMRKTHYEIDCVMTWTGLALSKPGQDLSITLDDIPLTFHHHSGMYKISMRMAEGGSKARAEGGLADWIIIPQSCMRYATEEVIPSVWYTAVHTINRDDDVRVDFVFLPQDLEKLELYLKGNIPRSEAPPVKILKHALTCPVKMGIMTLPKKEEGDASQLLANPKDNLDSKSSITDCKYIALNSAFLFFIALTLFVFVKSLNRSPKSKKLLMRH